MKANPPNRLIRAMLIGAFLIAPAISHGQADPESGATPAANLADDPVTQAMKQKRARALGIQVNEPTPAAAVPPAPSHPEIPVYLGADPKLIPSTGDDIRTQVIPVQNVDALRLRQDLLPFITTGTITANGGSNCIVITDTTAHVHRLVQIIFAMDQTAGEANKARASIAGRTLPRPEGGQRQYAGTVTAPVAEIVAPSDGFILNVPVVSGQAVQAGAPIAEMDSAAQTAELNLRAAELDIAKVKLDAAITALPEERKLAQAELNRAQVAVGIEKRQLEALHLSAAFAGTLTTIDVKPGQFVRAGARLTTVVSATDVNVDFAVPAIDALPREGEKVTLRIDDQNVAGEVTYVSPVVDKATNTVQMRSRIDADTAHLKPGAFVVVTVGAR